jgi:hypothetical protein
MVCWFGSFMVNNASFINFSYIVAVSYSGGGNRKNHRPAEVIDKLDKKCCIEYTSP